MIWEYPIAAAAGVIIGYALRKYSQIAESHIYESLSERRYRREQDLLGGESEKPAYHIEMKIAGKDPALAERMQNMLDANFGSEDDDEIFASLHHACKHNPWSEVNVWNRNESREEAFALANTLVGLCRQERKATWTVVMQIIDPDCQNPPIEYICFIEQGGYNDEN